MRSPLYAPRTDRTVVSAPPPSEWAALVRENRRLLTGLTCTIQGRSAGWLRQQARRELLERALVFTRTSLAAAGSGARCEAPDPDSPWIATGHQPELFHPGVWIKNFAVAALARQCGGLSVNLVVDNDRVKNLAVRVPKGPLDRPQVALVPLDRWRGDVPYEEHRVADEDVFRAFGRRVEEYVSSLGIQPLVRDLWGYALAASSTLGRLGDRIVAARRAIEANLGVHNLEIPVRELCSCEAFLWFLCHIAAQAPEFCAIHNRILARFRAELGIKDPLRPVPDLAQTEGWWELPFWVWHRGRPTRRALHALVERDAVWLGDGVEWQLKLKLSPERDACCAVEQLKELVEAGQTKIRTRALTTTLFMRLFVADAFVHGLGGAIYDRITDELIRQFYGAEVPKFITLSATVYLPVARPSVDRSELVRLKQQLRACIYNPQRFLRPDQLTDREVHELVERKNRLIRECPVTRRERRERFLEFRRINARLAELLDPQIESLRRRIAEIERMLGVKKVLENREYPFCVYPAEYLAQFYSEWLGRQLSGTVTSSSCGNR